MEEIDAVMDGVWYRIYHTYYQNGQVDDCNFEDIIERFEPVWTEQLLQVLEKNKPLSFFKEWIKEGMEWKVDWDNEKDQARIHVLELEMWVYNSNPGENQDKPESTLLNDGLLLACTAAHIPMADFLLSLGANAWGDALDTACDSGDMNMVQFLLFYKRPKMARIPTRFRRTDYTSIELENSMARVASNADLSLFQFLFSLNVFIASSHVCEEACSGGSLEIVRLLLFWNQFAIKDRENGIVSACEHGHVEVCKLLVSSIDDVSGDFWQFVANNVLRKYNDPSIPMLKFIGHHGAPLKGLNFSHNMHEEDQYALFTALGFPLDWFTWEQEKKIRTQRLKNRVDATRHLQPFLIPVLVDMMVSFI